MKTILLCPAAGLLGLAAATALRASAPASTSLETRASLPPPELQQPAAQAAATAQTISMTFDPVPDVEHYERPTWSGDLDYASWNSIFVKAVNSKVDFPGMKGGDSIKVMRTGPSEVKLDANGDDHPEAVLPMTGNITPIRIKIGKGATERDWAFLAVTGMEKDRYQGIEIDLQLRSDGGGIYFSPCASMVGQLGSTAIRVFDDNVDGQYGSAPQSWGFIGVREGEFQFEMDSVLIGNGKHARPWSTLMEVNGQWYKFEPQGWGKTIVATPTQVETGFLKLDFKGPTPPLYVVAHLKDKNQQGCYYDLVEGGSKGVSVPAGEYELYQGLIRKGKRREIQKCIIVPDKQADTVVVKPGATATLKLGAPFSFDFVATDDGSSATLIGKTVGVVGCAHEHYTRVWGAAPRPEISLRKAGTKKGEKGEKTQLAEDGDAVGKKGWEYAWFPFDMVVNKKRPEDKVEAQLFEKKNKLFGDVESDWKPVP